MPIMVLTQMEKAVVFMLSMRPQPLEIRCLEITMPKKGEPYRYVVIPPLASVMFFLLVMKSKIMVVHSIPMLPVCSKTHFGLETMRAEWVAVFMVSRAIHLKCIIVFSGIIPPEAWEHIFVMCR